MTDFFPGFLEEPPTVAVLTLPLPTIGNAAKKETEPDRPRFDPGASFRLRTQIFVRSLSKERRAEIARRPRFRNQPYVRRVDDLDTDDQLP